ncbi:MAG: 30S ribosomal protein THX [Xanthomonadaceae bacterium]|jgi:30S ribosomal protein S31|nr:30S ribosomal protein THX [Xanthomonadaceae bacterium]
MGKGDRKTAKGKRYNSSYGNSRSHGLTKAGAGAAAPVAKKTVVTKAGARKTAAAKKAATKAG